MPVTLVIVDDDEDFRLIARALLRSLSDTVTVVGEAADGQAALVLVRRERPDIVITDLVMPHLNGVDLTRRIREELPETQVILVSSYTEDAYMLMASDSGADVFVNKRVITSSLVPAVRDLIRRRLSGGATSLPWAEALRPRTSRRSDRAASAGSGRPRPPRVVPDGPRAIAARLTGRAPPLYFGCSDWPTEFSLDRAGRKGDDDGVDEHDDRAGARVQRSRRAGGAGRRSLRGGGPGSPDRALLPRDPRRPRTARSPSP